MASPHSIDYTSFSKDDLVSLIESKVSTINLYENEMQSSQSKIDSLKKEKQELATLNMNLSHGFSTLEAFVANILGQKNMKDMRDNDNNYDLEKLKSTFTRYYNYHLMINLYIIYFYQILNI
jgi:predicted RNase H-like nuclease (RuvC/YqgF family)